MKCDIIINLNKLVNLNLSPTEYCYLICLLKKEDYIGLLNENQKINLLKSLEEKRYLKIMSDNEVILRQKALNILDDISPGSVEEWIDDWRKLFPERVKSSGRPVRGDKKACLKKMIAFCKEYPEYTKEQIFDATKIYVFEKKKDDYSYMVCADYFIYKETTKGQRVSYLASLLEDLENSTSYLKTMEEGGGAFQKEI